MSLNREHPGNLPLLPMGWGAANLDFDGDADFWQEVRRVTADSSLAENLDIAMAGESSPRIWLFLHEPGQGALSAAAALVIARELGARDQAVLILDCDDSQSRLTRWAGRHEQEGWIDMVRYGASVLTSGVALPFEGRRAYILGVGSFSPTDVEAQEAEDLVNRLKRQADDLVLVAPADAIGKLWAPLADIRLLCWDRARKSPDIIDKVCKSFEDAGSQLTGLIGFGLPEEGMSLGTGGAREPAQATAAAPPEDAGTVPPAEDLERDPEEEDERLEAAELADVDFEDDDEQEDGPQTVPDDREDILAAEAREPRDEEEEGGQLHDGDEPRSETVAPAGAEDEPAAEPAAAAATGGGSSRVFWATALISLALIVVVAFYYFQVVRVDGTGPEDGRPAEVAGMNQVPPLPVAGSVTPDESLQDQLDEPTGTGTTGDEDLPAVEEETAAEPAAMGSGTAGQQADTGGTAAGDAGTSRPQGTVPPEDEASAEAGDTTGEDTTSEDSSATGTPPAEPEPAAEPEGPVFTMDPYLQPVGADGWALHLFSFPDTVDAGKAARRLEDKGFQTAIRVVELKDKGRWFRVYVGSFLTRSEALAAKDLLLEELELDWARPTEF